MQLEKADLEHLVVINPRRENFLINKPKASKEQIEWEYKPPTNMKVEVLYDDGQFTGKCA